MEIWNHPRRDEHRARAGEFGVVDVVAAYEVVFEMPGVRRLRIFLNVPRHNGIAAAAHSNVERRSRSARVGHARRKAHPLDESLGIEGCLDLPRSFALPPLVARVFGFN